MSHTHYNLFRTGKIFSMVLYMGNDLHSSCFRKIFAFSCVAFKGLYLKYVCKADMGLVVLTNTSVWQADATIAIEMLNCSRPQPLSESYLLFHQDLSINHGHYQVASRESNKMKMSVRIYKSHPISTQAKINICKWSELCVKNSVHTILRRLDKHTCIIFIDTLNARRSVDS